MAASLQFPNKSFWFEDGQRIHLFLDKKYCDADWVFKSLKEYNKPIQEIAINACASYSNDICAIPRFFETVAQLVDVIEKLVINNSRHWDGSMYEDLCKNLKVKSLVIKSSIGFNFNPTSPFDLMNKYPQWLGEIQHFETNNSLHFHLEMFQNMKKLKSIKIANSFLDSDSNIKILEYIVQKCPRLEIIDLRLVISYDQLKYILPKIHKMDSLKDLRLVVDNFMIKDIEEALVDSLKELSEKVSCIKLRGVMPRKILFQT